MRAHKIFAVPSMPDQSIARTVGTDDLSRPIAEPAEGSSQNFWRRASFTILGLAAILFLAGLGARALWASEFRWAEIAREMLATGNYFWPTINGRVYYDKPLGSYWLVVAAARLTGAMDETAARLPCALTGLFAVLVLMLIVRRLYDWRTAAWSGLILATSYSFVFFSRHASADVETLAGELVALAIFLRNEDRRGGGWWIVGLWLVMALTSLTKGLLGFVLPILVIGAYCCCRSGWVGLCAGITQGTVARRIGWLVECNRWFFNWTTIPAMIAALGVYAAPFVISNHLMHSERGLYLVYRENVVRYFEPFDHKGPIYLYFYIIFMLMAPWSVLLPGALAHLHRAPIESEQRAQADRFALVYFWATFVFFTLSGSRRSYYLLPILPAAAIIVARLITSSAASLDRVSWWLTRIGYGLFAITTIIGCVALVPPSWIMPRPFDQLPILPAPLIYGLFWLVAAASAIYALRRMTPARIGVSVGIIAYLAMVYIYLVFMPAAENYRAEKPFAGLVMAKVGPQLRSLAFYNNLEGFYYIEPFTPHRLFLDPAALHKAIANGRVRWLMVKDRDLASLKLDGVVVAREQSFPWQGERGVREAVVLVRLNGEPAASAN
jgi:4-amino-4-deoxy-L-arabinose transferase-like glycosyltransferase